jgi:hypothetical protein
MSNTRLAGGLVPGSFPGTGARVPAPVAPFAVQSGEGTVLRTPTDDMVTIKAATAAPRGAVLYRSRSEQGWEELSLDLMADLDLKGEGDNSMPGNRQLMPRRMGWCAGGSA